MPPPSIRTDYWPKPIGIRSFDWQAMRDGDEPPCPVGFGRTEAGAVADLMEQIEDEEDSAC